MKNHYLLYQRAFAISVVIVGLLFLSCHQEVVSDRPQATPPKLARVEAARHDRGGPLLDIAHEYNWGDYGFWANVGSVFFSNAGGERRYFRFTQFQGVGYQYAPFPTDKSDNMHWAYAPDFSPDVLIRAWGDNNGLPGDIYWTTLYGASIDATKYYFLLLSKKPDGTLGDFPADRTSDNEYWKALPNMSRALDMNLLMGEGSANLVLYPWVAYDPAAQVGDIFYYDNHYSNTKEREYFMLMNTYSAGKYGYFPINRTNNPYWIYLGADNTMSTLRASLQAEDRKVIAVLEEGSTKARKGDYAYRYTQGSRQREFFRKESDEQAPLPADAASNDHWDYLPQFLDFSLTPSDASPLGPIIPYETIVVHEANPTKDMYARVGDVYSTWNFVLAKPLYYRLLRVQQYGMLPLDNKGDKTGYYSWLPDGPYSTHYWQYLDFSKDDLITYLSPSQPNLLYRVKRQSLDQKMRDIYLRLNMMDNWLNSVLLRSDIHILTTRGSGNAVYLGVSTLNDELRNTLGAFFNRRNNDNYLAYVQALHDFLDFVETIHFQAIRYTDAGRDVLQLRSSWTEYTQKQRKWVEENMPLGVRQDELAQPRSRTNLDFGACVAAECSMYHINEHSEMKRR